MTLKEKIAEIVAKRYPIEAEIYHYTTIKLILTAFRETVPKKKSHIIDMELYHDSGGGEMCEVCGKQGMDLNGDCVNDFNSAIDQINKELI